MKQDSKQTNPELLAWILIRRIQRRAKLTLSATDPPPGKERRRRKRRPGTRLLAAAFVLLIPVVDAIGDPSISDAIIGDGAEDVITMKASVCITPDASLVYIEGSFDSDRCWTVDLRRAALP